MKRKACDIHFHQVFKTSGEPRRMVVTYDHDGRVLEAVVTQPTMADILSARMLLRGIPALVGLNVSRPDWDSLFRMGGLSAPTEMGTLMADTFAAWESMSDAQRMACSIETIRNA